MLEDREVDLPERWSAKRKSEIVLRLLRGEESLLLPDFDPAAGGFLVSTRLASGLTPEVLLSAVEPRTGDKLTIRSRLANRGSEVVVVHARTCGFDIESRLEYRVFEEPFCFLYSLERDFGPGVTALYTTLRVVVESRPGVYRIRVREALDPEIWTEFDIRVR